MRKLLLLLCLSASLFGVTAFAQPAGPPPQPGTGVGSGYHEHDGFFLRLAAGVGGINQTALSRGSGEVTATGAGAVAIIDLAIGGIIARNLALHFSAWGFGVPKESSVELPAGGGLSKLKGLSGFGAGLTWYAANNLYVTGAIGGATMKVETFGVASEVPGGFALQLGVGKEWWVSANWGLGLAGFIAFARISDPIGVWNTAWGGLAFSATYN